MDIYQIWIEISYKLIFPIIFLIIIMLLQNDTLCLGSFLSQSGFRIKFYPYLHKISLK